MGSKYDHLNDLIKAQADKGHGRKKIADYILSLYPDSGWTDRGLAHHVSKIIHDYRITKQQPALAEECERVGIDLSSVNHFWHKGKQFSIHAKNTAPSYFELRDAIIEDMQTHAPRYPIINFKERKEANLLVISPADIHIGKLCSIFETGDAYDADIAFKRVLEGVEGIVSRSLYYKVDKILLLAGNDILHVDTPRSTTTSGTFQDSHLMWYDAFMKAKDLMVKVIEMLIPIAPIRIDYNPSNHDFTHGFFLIDTLKSWFSNVNSVTFNCDMRHRKYTAYHKNLIGSTHGDGAKHQDLGLLMAHEAAEFWHQCTHRYFYTHHLHHKTSKDYMSVCVEGLRSASGTDGWHHRNGYQHAPKAIEGFMHHKEYGQVMRFNHIF